MIKILNDNNIENLKGIDNGCRNDFPAVRTYN